MFKTMSIKSVILYIKFTIFESILNNYYNISSPQFRDPICGPLHHYIVNNIFLILNIYYSMLLFKLVYILSILYYLYWKYVLYTYINTYSRKVNLIMLTFNDNVSMKELYY